MKTKKLKTPAFAGLAIGLAVVLAGCASAGYRKSEQTASSLQSSANRIEVAGLQVQLAVATLNDLINNPQPDLRPQFEKFSTAVGKTDSLVTSIREADKNMQARSTSYFVNWEKELAAIQNEGIRANGQSRKLAVLSKCKNVHNACLTTETQASPLLSDLNDVQRFLSSDLTPGGLAAIKNTTARVNQLSASVQESVNKLVADMRALGAAMSPQIIMEKAL